MTKITTFDKSEFLEDMVNIARVDGFRFTQDQDGGHILKNGTEVIEYNFRRIGHGGYIDVKTAYCPVPEQPKDYAEIPPKKFGWYKIWE